MLLTIAPLGWLCSADPARQSALSDWCRRTVPWPSRGRRRPAGRCACTSTSTGSPRRHSPAEHTPGITRRPLWSRRRAPFLCQVWGGGWSGPISATPSVPGCAIRRYTAHSRDRGCRAVVFSYAFHIFAKDLIILFIEVCNRASSVNFLSDAD